MTTDTMEQDIAQVFDHLLDAWTVDDKGRKAWPELFFAAPAGFRPLFLDIKVPAGAGPHPLVVFIHGGAWMSGHPHIDNAVLAGMKIFDSLLDAGYAVARISYRLSGEALFPAQLHDCKAAVRYLRHHAKRFGVDPERFAVMGESAGAHLALMTGLVQDKPELEGEIGITGVSSRVKCIVEWYGPASMLTMDDTRPPHATLSHNAEDAPEALLLGAPVQTVKERAQAASPETYITTDSPPLLIQHGTKDRIVPFGQARQLEAKLNEVDATYEIQVLEGADHCFWGIDTSPVMPRVVTFLDRYL